MRWPFQSKNETDIRIFRDPQTDAVMLRLIGPVEIPSFENPILQLTVTMDITLDPEAIRRLDEQLSHFAKRELEA